MGQLRKTVIALLMMLLPVAGGKIVPLSFGEVVRLAQEGKGFHRKPAVQHAYERVALSLEYQAAQEPAFAAPALEANDPALGKRAVRRSTSRPEQAATATAKRTAIFELSVGVDGKVTGARTLHSTLDAKLDRAAEVKARSRRFDPGEARLITAVVELTADEVRAVRAVHTAAVRPPGDGPTPFPPPQDGGSGAPSMDANTGTPGDLDPHPFETTGRVSFEQALIGIYVNQMTAAIVKSDGSLKMVVGCPDRAQGSDRVLADRLMGLPLPNAFAGAILGFEDWYDGALAAGQARSINVSEAWKQYAASWAASHGSELEPLRPMVADAVLAAGLRRADDLMVTPAGYVASPEWTRSADCIGCAPPLACSCQTYNAVLEDCSGDPQSCTVIERTVGRRLAPRLP